MIGIIYKFTIKAKYGIENLYIPKTDNIPQGYHKGLTRGLKK